MIMKYATGNTELLVKTCLWLKTHLGPLELPLLMCFITIMHLNSYLNPGCLNITL